VIYSSCLVALCKSKKLTPKSLNLSSGIDKIAELWSKINYVFLAKIFHPSGYITYIGSVSQNMPYFPDPHPIRPDIQGVRSHETEMVDGRFKQP